MIYFKFSEKPQRSEINEAYMHIHVQESGSLHNITNFNTEYQFSINIQVNRITFNSQRKKASVTYTNVSKKLSKRELTEGKWVRVNVTNMVLEYLTAKEQLDSLQAREQRDNLTVTIKIQDPEERISFNHSPESSFWTPYIELRVSDSAHKRTRRTIGMDCKEGSKEVRCCRYPLIVDFEEFGWDFIIAPKQYRAYYCGGDCPYSYLQQYPHTHLVHLVEPPGSNGPCCSPKKVSGITMLYFDHDMNIIYGNVPGMVVESCGCS